MPQRHKHKILLAKREAVYGTEETLAPATDAILTRDLAVQLMQGPTEERTTDRGMLGHDKLFHTSPHVGLSFGVEAAGSGAAGTAPAWGRILRACGYTETIAVGVDVKYNPTSLLGAFDALTMAYHQSGNLHKALGARGTVAASFQAGQLPMFNYTFQGLRAAPATAAFPIGIVQTAFQDPLPVNDDNTDFTLHGFSAKLLNLQFDQANQVVARVVVGVKEVIITQRLPVATITIEETDISAKDWHAIIAAHSTGAMTLTHGVGAGKIVELTAPAVQLTAPQLGNQDELVTIQFTARLRPVAGDDEVRWTVK